MEKIKKNSRSIKWSFTISVAVTMLIAFLCSVITIYGCYRIQKVILPDSREIWLHSQTTLSDGTITKSQQRYILDEPAELVALMSEEGLPQNEDKTEYMIESIESSFSSLSPNKKTIYQIMSILMVLLPLLYSIAGIGLCAWWFYQKKLAPPICILSDATEHIRTQDLDFKINYDNSDEMGQLCRAFEKMRQALYENNRQLWNMLDERRILQASVAHDLRNPISIIEGYVEYMQQNIHNGNLDEEKLKHILSNLAVTAKRMEHYTDYIRDLHAIEEIEVDYSDVVLSDFLREVVDTFEFFAKQHGYEFVCEYISIPPHKVSLDSEIFYRILENVFSNAVRYAKNTIRLVFALKDNMLSTTVIDDGQGFSKQMLYKKAVLF